MVIKNNCSGRNLSKAEISAGLIPKFVAIRLDQWSFHAVHYDTTIGSKVLQHFSHYFLESSSVTSNEYSIRTRKVREVRIEEVTDMDIDTWGTKTTGILTDDVFTLRTDLESANLQVRELQTSLDRYATCAETYIPEDTF
jgi:hypothetical protein